LLERAVDELGRLLGRGGDELLEYMRAGFAKNEPVSCLQHCLSVALVAAGLAEHMGYSDYEVGVAYAAGLFHDYEKLGPGVAGLDDDEKVEILADHLDRLGVGDVEEARRALRIARGLEEGGIPLPDRRVAGIVKLADYIMGVRYEAHDPVAVAARLASLGRELLGAPVEAVPVLLGGQRPITLYAAEKLVAKLVEECGGRPLVATPMGLVYLPGGDCGPHSDLLKSLASELVREFSEQPSGRRGGRGRRTARSPVEVAEQRGQLLCRALAEGKNPGSAVSVKTAFSLRDAEEVIKSLLEGSVPEGRRPYVLTGLFVIAAKLLNPEAPKDAVPVIARLFGVSARKWTELPRALGLCEGRMPTGLRERLEKLQGMLREAAGRLQGGEAVDYIAERLGELVHIPLAGAQAGAGGAAGGSVRCSLCRAPVPESLARRFTLKKYRDEITRAGIKLAQEVFHPDVQGAPSDTRIAEEVKKLPVCPLCFYEARYMARSGVVPGNWSVVVHYGPAVAYDLLQAAKQALNQGLPEVTVHADPLSAKLVAPYGTAYLTKRVLYGAFDSWYLVGGSLAVTRNPFTLPTPSARIIYLDKSDAVIEAVDSMMQEALRRARRSRDYWGEAVHVIRRVAHQLLRLYVDSLEEARLQGRVRLRPSLRLPVSVPSLTVMALYTASRLREKR